MENQNPAHCLSCSTERENKRVFTCRTCKRFRHWECFFPKLTKKQWNSHNIKNFKCEGCNRPAGIQINTPAQPAAQILPPAQNLQSVQIPEAVLIPEAVQASLAPINTISSRVLPTPRATTSQARRNMVPQLPIMQPRPQIPRATAGVLQAVRHIYEKLTWRNFHNIVTLYLTLHYLASFVDININVRLLDSDGKNTSKSLHLYDFLSFLIQCTYNYGIIFMMKHVHGQLPTDPHPIKIAMEFDAPANYTVPEP